MMDNRSTQIKRVMAAGGARAVALGLALGLGCDGQADPSYEGEPLASVSGQVEAALDVGHVGHVEVGILWMTASSDFDMVCTGKATTASEPSACVVACGEVGCDNLESWAACAGSCPDVTDVSVDVTTSSVPFLTGAVGQTTPASGEFPAQFRLDILEPPPAEALIGSVSGERLAVGFIVALDPAGEPWRVDSSEDPRYPDWLLGGSETHLLLYAPDAVPKSSIWFRALRVALTPGYHLLELLPSPAEGDDSSEVREVPDADASQVLLRIAPPDSIAWPLRLF